MNYIERFVDRKVRRLAWKNTVLDNSFADFLVESKISKYHWVIKDKEDNVIYDTEVEGYEGLLEYTVVIDAFDLIKDAEKNNNVKRRKLIEKPEVIFTLDSQLWSIFPYENLEQMCMS